MAPNFVFDGAPLYSAVLYHTMAISFHIAPYEAYQTAYRCKALPRLSYTDLRRLWALRACYAALCLEHIYNRGKDGADRIAHAMDAFCGFHFQQPHTD